MSAKPLHYGLLLAGMALIVPFFGWLKQQPPQSRYADSEFSPLESSNPPGSSSEQKVDLGKNPEKSQASQVLFLSGSKPSSSADSFILEVEALAKNLSGSNLRNEIYKLIARASVDLNGIEMARFLESVHSSLGGEIGEYAIQKCLSALFHCPIEEQRKVFDWALNLANSAFQLKVLPQVGWVMADMHQHEDFETVMPQLAKSQGLALLDGYCRRVAAFDGPKAVETYLRLKPEGADFSGLSEVMRSLGEKNDFAAVDELLPDDSRSIAQETRAALLKRWSEFQPKKALDHVMANQARLSLEQMDVVLDTWAETQREAAENWVREQIDPQIRSQGAHAMATHLENEFPDRAWNWALEIQDTAKRDRKLKQVHATWLKQDPDAAERARLSLGN